MASLVYPLLCKLPFLLLLLLIHYHLGRGTEPQIQSKFRVLDLLTKNSCSLPRVSDPSTLRVVHPFGPCSPFNLSQKLSHQQIFAQDGARTALLRRRIAMISTGAGAGAAEGVEATELPVQIGRSFGTYNYVVTVGVGTPRRDFTVIFDTGSDFSWIQCRPCSPCYRQKEPLFDPSMSSTYASVRCNSSECEQIGSRSTSCSAASEPSTCRYKMLYGDLSESIGTVGRDTLRLGATAEVPGFVFGCGNSNRGIFGRVAGLMSLGRGSISLAAQVSPGISGSVFSYCLPQTESSFGFLAIGSQRRSAAVINATYTPMLVQLPSLYFVALVAIEVGGERLPIPRTAFPSFGTVMDSGTVITQLPLEAYEALRSEFRRQMRRYREAPALSVLDTCYDYNRTGMSVPMVSLVFGGGGVLDVGTAGILYVEEEVSRACLAFRRSSSGLSIIGNMQQRGSEVIYDIANKKIGFLPNRC